MRGRGVHVMRGVWGGWGGGSVKRVEVARVGATTWRRRRFVFRRPDCPWMLHVKYRDPYTWLMPVGFVFLPVEEEWRRLTFWYGSERDVRTEVEALNNAPGVR